MDKIVIEKIIKRYGNCPDFKYENPLLDKNVADLLSRGFVNLLRTPGLSEQRRLLVLRSIRRSCKIEPHEHLCVDNNVTEVVRKAYEEHLSEYNIDKVLDSFLIRHLKEMNINSIYSTSLQPDIIQALANLNGMKQETPETLLKDIIHWNVDGSYQNSYIELLKPLWNIDFISSRNAQCDDISIKIKPLIEQLLLTCASEMLRSVIIDEEEWFSENKDLMQLVEICTVSNECFQICCCIMNNLFISTNFDKQLQKFIELFIAFIKGRVAYISQLYPSNIQHIVMLLDIELENLDAEVREAYIECTLKQLQELHRNSENNVIMLLSHFKMWFDHYYNRGIQR